MTLIKLESWKLFLLILIPAMLGVIDLLMGKFFLGDSPRLLILGQIFTLVFVGVFVYWIYSLGTQLRQLRPNQNFSLALFKSALVFSTLYRVSLEAYGLWYQVTYHSGINLESELWIIPMHLLATLAALYCFYTNSRLLVSAERKQPSDFKDVWKTFGLILAFPIGIWFIQPRLQKLFART
jgi:hypothetical protein